MLVLGSRLYSTPVMSLQTGARLAVTAQPIIDPGKLKIYAYELTGPLLTRKPSYLRTEDVRELGQIGMIVDSSDEFVSPDDIIKLQELIELGFPLVGMAVVDDFKRKLGKVEDYTVDTKSFMVQQLNVRRGFLRGITDTGLLIHRSQIIEINDDAIVVHTNARQVRQKATDELRQTFVNPFRGEPQAPQTDQTSRN
jgi:uncharacterized protein YrrD